MSQNSICGSIDRKAYDIIMKGWNREALTKDECIYLLGFDESSPETNIMRAAANDLTRKSTGNAGQIYAQIGIMIGPCEANCKFCSFGASHTSVGDFVIDDDELRNKINALVEYDDVDTIYLMTMHSYDIDELVHKVKVAKKAMGDRAHISLNIGDTTYEHAVELKKAGAEKAYHVCRLGEGLYTELKPEDRMQSMRNFKDAGLTLLSCTEPVGPEHTAAELVEHYARNISLGCESLGVMRRVAVEGSPLAHLGHITESRLTQLAAAFTLFGAGIRGYPGVDVHEPCQLGFYSGARQVTAEYGGNPRDLGLETEAHRGLSTAECRVMLFDAGFTSLAGAGGRKVDLNMDYLRKTGSF